MSKLKVLMFGCSSNLCKRFDLKHSSGISAALQSRDMSEMLCISEHARKSLISDIPKAVPAAWEART